VLVNHSRKAIYFGVTNNFPVRYIQHVLLNQVQATKYWSSEDKIEHAIVQEHMTQEEASEFAHALEKEKFPELSDYKVIHTSGI
jgi:predicted GIY-YIG superfamily endonuclease